MRSRVSPGSPTQWCATLSPRSSRCRSRQLYERLSVPSLNQRKRAIGVVEGHGRLLEPTHPLQGMVEPEGGEVLLGAIVDPRLGVGRSGELGGGGSSAPHAAGSRSPGSLLCPPTDCRPTIVWRETEDGRRKTLRRSHRGGGTTDSPRSPRGRRAGDGPAPRPGPCRRHLKPVPDTCGGRPAAHLHLTDEQRLLVDRGALSHLATVGDERRLAGPRRGLRRALARRRASGSCR